MDIVASFLSAFQLVIAAAPQAVDLFNKAKEFIASLFTHKLITLEEQNRAHAHLDALMAAALAGQRPPHWIVQPDPAPPPAPPGVPPSTP